MHPNPRKVAPFIIIAILAVFGWWYFSSGRAKAESVDLTASGTIESTQVVVAPELSGQIAEVLADEGDAVKAGQVLIRFQDALLKAQLAQAQANLAQAQANYNLVAAGPSPEQRQLNVATAEQELINAQQALKALHDNAPLTISRMQKAMADADKNLDDANDRVDSIKSESDPEDIDRAEAQIVLANDKLKKAREDYDRFFRRSDKNVGRAWMEIKVADAKTAYDAAVDRLNNLLGTANKYDLAVAEANQGLATAQLADAKRQFDLLVDGIDPDALALAQSRLATAEAHLASAKADPTAEQLALAKAQVEAAQSALGVLQTQSDKLTITSPLDGIVLSRNVEPGEVSLPASPLLTLAPLDRLTITIYIPEDRYGTINLGQAAKVAVDSYPGTTFTGTVSHIADKAEFTPRNVQTAEGRRTTVFAIKLDVDNSDGKLKPGMPADVTFGK